MRLNYLHMLALAAAASLPLMAQQPASSPQTEAQPGTAPQATSPQQTNPQLAASQDSNATAVPVPSTANPPEVANPALRPVAGELVSKLDTKSAKTGDSVIVKTTQTATTANGIEIPKGSKIVGHVIDVEAQGKSGPNSRVTLQFDQAQLKGGQNLPIRTMIQSVAPAGAAPGPDAAGGASAPLPSAGSGTASGSPGSPSPAANSSANAQPSASASAAGAPAAGTVVARNGNVVIRTTAIPGVFLAGNATGQPFLNAAGALVGAKQDVQLEGGTTMVVAVMTAPSSANRR